MCTELLCVQSSSVSEQLALESAHEGCIKALQGTPIQRRPYRKGHALLITFNVSALTDYKYWYSGEKARVTAYLYQDTYLVLY